MRLAPWASNHVANWERSEEKWLGTWIRGRPTVNSVRNNQQPGWWQCNRVLFVDWITCFWFVIPVSNWCWQTPSRRNRNPTGWRRWKHWPKSCWNNLTILDLLKMLFIMWTLLIWRVLQIFATLFERRFLLPRHKEQLFRSLFSLSRLGLFLPVK